MDVIISAIVGNLELKKKPVPRVIASPPTNDVLITMNSRPNLKDSTIPMITPVIVRARKPQAYENSCCIKVISYISDPKKKPPSTPRNPIASQIAYSVSIPKHTAVIRATVKVRIIPWTVTKNSNMLDRTIMTAKTVTPIRIPDIGLKYLSPNIPMNRPDKTEITPISHSWFSKSNLILYKSRTGHPLACLRVIVTVQGSSLVTPVVSDWSKITLVTTPAPSASIFASQMISV